MRNESRQSHRRPIDAVQAGPAFGVNPYLGMRGAPVDVDDLLAIRVSAERAHDWHRQMVEEGEQQIEKARAAIEREVEAMSPAVVERERVKQLRLREVRMAIVARSALPRAKLIEKVERAARRVAAVEPIFSDPVGHLMTVTVGGEAGRARERYDTLVRHAGTLELHNLGIRAAATGDQALAASVVSAYAGLSKSDQAVAAIDPSHLAETVLGDRYRAGALALQVIANRAFMVRSRDAEFASGRVDPRGRLERGLRQYREQGSRARDFLEAGGWS